METNYYLKKIKEDFSKRQRGNRAYSLRAYARDLQMPASTLSQVLLGNRPLPLKSSKLVLDKISLSAKERTLFIESLGRRHVTLDSIQVNSQESRFLLDETYFQIISEWEHYAALILFDCDGFVPTPEVIAKRLKITRLRAEVVIDHLLKYEMLKKDAKGKLVRSHTSFRTTEDVSSQALKASHRDTIEMSKKKLDEVDLELRDFSSMMIAIDTEKIPETKVIIREFRQKMAELLKAGKRTEVYQLAIQFYPMTEQTPKPTQNKKAKKETK